MVVNSRFAGCLERRKIEITKSYANSAELLPDRAWFNCHCRSERARALGGSGFFHMGADFGGGDAGVVAAQLL